MKVSRVTVAGNGMEIRWPFHVGTSTVEGLAAAASHERDCGQHGIN